jgi:hypothetical protein
MNLAKTLSLREGFDRFVSTHPSPIELPFRERVERGRGIYERREEFLRLSPAQLYAWPLIEEVRDEIEIELTIFRPFIRHCEDGFYLLFGRPSKISAPDEQIPAYILHDVMMFDFRQSRIDEARRFDEQFDGFVGVRIFDVVAELTAQSQEDKIRILLQLHRMHPRETGATLAETARQLESVWLKYGFPWQSTSAFVKAVGRAVSENVRADRSQKKSV